MKRATRDNLILVGGIGTLLALAIGIGKGAESLVEREERIEAHDHRVSDAEVMAVLRECSKAARRLRECGEMVELLEAELGKQIEATDRCVRDLVDAGAP